MSVSCILAAANEYPDSGERQSKADSYDDDVMMLFQTLSR